MRPVVTLLLAAVGLLASAAPSPAQNRSPALWTVGVAYGPAKARITGASDSLTTGWLEGPAQAVRIARDFGPHVRLGYEHQAWLREQGFNDLKVRAGAQLEALSVTANLGRRGSAIGGLYVTAGGGWAHCRLTFLEPIPPGKSAIGDTHEIVYKKDEFGWGGFGGIGYEFRISRSFSAGALVSANFLGIGDEIFDTVKFVPLLANLNWSF